MPVPSTIRPSTIRPGRLPYAVYLLGVTIFCLGTSEFMIAGLLPGLTRDLDVSVPRAGLLITAFAVGMLVGAPVMTILTLRLPRKVTLLAAAGLFVVAHLLGALTTDFGLLMASRVLAAVACATFWSVAAVVAIRITPQDRTARALAVLVGGLSVANVLGVPAATWTGERFGWQAAFVAVAVATTACAVLVATLIREPAPVAGADPSGGQSRGDSDGDTVGGFGARLRSELAVFGRLRLWLALATTALFQGAVFCAFSYFAPMLIDVAGVAESRVPAYLLLFGVGSFVGVTIGGRYADRGPLVNVVVSLLGSLATAGLLVVLAPSRLGVGIGLLAFALASFSIAGALNARVMGLAGRAPTLASSVNTSAFNVGNAFGPWLGGLVIAGGLGYVAPVWVAIGLLALALGVAGVSAVVERRTDRRRAVVARDARRTPAALSARECRESG